MGMRVEETLNAAAGVLETMTQNKVQKTQKAFAAFMDNAVKSSVDQVSGGAEESISSTVSDTASQSESEDVSLKNDDTSKVDDVKVESKEEVSSDVEVVEDGPSEEEMKLVAEIEDAIISLLAQQLGITVEEVTQTLEDMGMSAMELLDSSKLLEFTMQIKGVDDISVILTDENLMAQYKELAEEIDFTVEAVLKENNVTLEELPQMIENVSTEVVEEVSVEVVSVEEDTTSVETKAENDIQVSDEVTETKVVVETNETQQNDNSFAQQGKAEQQNVPVGVQMNNQNTNAVMEGLNNVQLSYAAADMEEIVNQIVEQIKVQVNADASSMEMQLNPETYGKLQLHVALKDGVITAQMTVENEAVRQALESQIVQLRETMNNQGLKVEAVEVTIASHEFDRNLQQESSANQQAFEEEQQKAAARRINLNLNGEDWLEEDIEQLSDAEALERKIMLESGNRMSIQA